MVLTVMAIVVAATFAVTGGVKLFGVRASLAIHDSLDIPATQWRLIGVMEWLAAAGVLVGLTYRPLGLAAAIGLSALLVGAMITRVRAARRHGRSEAGGVAVDVLTFALAASTAAVFAMNL
jgi:hypothetical protein